MFLGRQRPHDAGEDEEFLMLRAQERLTFEEGDHLGEEIPPVADHEHQRGVLGAAVIRSQMTALHALGQQVKDPPALWRLADTEFGDELHSNSCTRIPLYGYVERTFSVYEASEICIQSFLLIVRTGRIFTAHVTTLKKGCDMNEYRRILGDPSI